MSQQINLFDAALQRKRAWLTAAHLAVAVLLVAAVIGAWGFGVRAQLAALDAESAALAPQLKAFEEQAAAASKQLADVKPDARIEAELAAARNLLVLRNDIVAALQKGLGKESGGFAEYLRGLARQAPHGLWLTGFSVAEGGAAMEIRGRMTNAALLPEYIRRLNGEKAFTGRAFAALKIAAPAPANTGTATAAGTAATPQGPAAAAYLEFTLIPVNDGTPETAGGGVGGKR